MGSLVNFTIRLPRASRAALDTYCAREGLSRADVIRQATDAFLRRHNGEQLDLTRIASTSEFSTLILDHLLTATPDGEAVREELVVEHRARMEKFHGVR